MSTGATHASEADSTTCSTCGGPKVTTWYYDEEHMPTGDLMNALGEASASLRETSEFELTTQSFEAADSVAIGNAQTDTGVLLTRQLRGPSR